jgi:hypothetical protein
MNTIMKTLRGLFLRTFTIATALLLIGMMAQAQAQSFLTNGLVAYYPFSGNANDASGGGNNGTVSNVFFTSDRFLNANGAVSLAGNYTSYIAIDTTNLNLHPPFTVSVWINPTAGLGTDGPRIISTAGYELACQYPPGGSFASTNRNVAMNVTDVGNAGTNTVSTNVIATGTWSQAVGVWTTNGGTLYVNGVWVGAYSTTLHPDYSRGFIPKVGRNSGSTSDSYGGLVDDLRVYNRALSSKEVAQLYACESTPPMTFLTNGLVAYYPFNANANDASGNSYNATVYNARLTADRFGMSNGAFSFNGSNAYISAPIPRLPSGTAPRTMTAWIRPKMGKGILSAVGYGAGNGSGQCGIGFLDITNLYFWKGDTTWRPQLPVTYDTWLFGFIRKVCT